MKTLLTSIAAGSLLAALVQAQTQPRFTITDLGVVGPAGQPYIVANQGLIGGSSTFPDNALHAVVWYAGEQVDISTPGLKGINSQAMGINQSGQIVGESGTQTIDPNGEDFCGFAALGLTAYGQTCVPFLWEYGVMTPLPTSGNNGVANKINNRGEVAGMEETGIADPNCPAPQKFQFKPVVWINGQSHQLPTYPGDMDGMAMAINDKGQVVGTSGDCVGFNPLSETYLQPLHATLWEDGIPVDLGNLGGTGHGDGIEAVNLNNHGQVVGNSDLKGDANFHGFLWSMEKGMSDLGTLPGDANSLAIGINDAGDVVGGSLDANFNPRAFFLRDGAMSDLNTLIPADSTLYLIFGCSINASGEIIGLAVDSSGNLHGYLATPVRSDRGSEALSTAPQSAASPMVLPEAVRKTIRGRFGMRGR
jgi:probable HAF family extracellular repeat protein